MNRNNTKNECVLWKGKYSLLDFNKNELRQFLKNKQKKFILTVCVYGSMYFFVVVSIEFEKRKEKVFKLKSFSYLRYVSEIGVFFIYVYNLMDMLGLSTYFFWRKWQIEIFFSWFMPQTLLSLLFEFFEYFQLQI